VKAKIMRICITKNMSGHSLEILPRAPETIDPPLASRKTRLETERLKCLQDKERDTLMLRVTSSTKLYSDLFVVHSTG